MSFGLYLMKATAPESERCRWYIVCNDFDAKSSDVESSDVKTGAELT
ncbi:hypothetical protein [Sorangium sp. So ce362]